MSKTGDRSKESARSVKGTTIKAPIGRRARVTPPRNLRAGWIGRDLAVISFSM
jgi:hypothetical protein